MTNPNSGDWQGLGDPQQAPRYRAIAELVPSLVTVLDVGCGEGVMASYLRNVYYWGVEPSKLAFTTAKNAGLLVFNEDFDQFARHHRLTFGAIIFNESLYYTKYPSAALANAWNLLRPGGILIVSIYQKQPTRKERLMPWLAVNRRCQQVVDKFGPKERKSMLVKSPDGSISWRITAITKPT